MGRQRSGLVLVLACVFFCSDASADYNRQLCVEGDGSAAVLACREFAERLSADKKRLQDLAKSLEATGRYEAATAVYEIAGRFYPQDRLLLQGLIRARGNLRSMSLVEPQSERTFVQNAVHQNNTTERISPCWTLQWSEALAGCEKERLSNPEDASLQERTGDVLRSIGRVDDSLAAYDKALSLSPSSKSLRRKRQALAQLVAGEQPGNDNGSRVAEANAIIEKSHTSESSIVAQLELLETLRARELIGKSEYRERRARIMGSVFPAEIRTGSKPAPLPRKSIDFEKFGRYTALIIGNNRYGKFQPLKTPVADAKAVGDLLRDSYGFEVTTLLNANRYQMAKAMSHLRKSTRAGDNVLIYYAGHGYLDETTKRGYWLPIDAEPDNSANWISTSDITDTLAGISAQHALVVADSCFSGSLLRAGNANLDDREAQIDRLFRKRSRTVLTSGGLEPVLDSGRGAGRAQHSIFANAFLDALRTNQDVLEVGRLFVGLRDAVTSYAEQTPQYAPIRNAGHDGGEFMFVPRPDR